MIAVKNPRNRDMMSNFQERVAKKMMQLATSTPEIWASQVRQMERAGTPLGAGADYEGMLAFVKSGSYRISTTTGAHVARELSVFDSVLPAFIDRHWVVLRAPARSTGFVTCDHPVFLDWSEPGAVVPPGYGMRNTMVAFPISNRVALLGTFEQAQDIEIDLHEDKVALFNGQIISQSMRQVFARDSDFPYRFTHSGKIMRGIDLLGDQVFRSRRSKKTPVNGASRP